MENENVVEVTEMNADGSTESYDLVATDDYPAFDSDEYEVVDEEEYNARLGKGVLIGSLLTLAVGAAGAGVVKLVRHFKQKKADKQQAVAAKERMNESLNNLNNNAAENIDYVEGDEVDSEEE